MSGNLRPVPRPSTKQHIRIWFEFYKLALADPRFSGSVDSSRSYYEPWGDVAGLSFDKWWAVRSHLFDDLRVREVQSVSRNDAVLYLALPLALGTKRAMQQVKELFVTKQRAVSERLGEQPNKSTGVGAARFSLTRGSELRGRTVDTVLRVYRDVYLPAGCPPIGKEFAERVIEYFRSGRTKLKVHFLPTSPDNPGGISQDQLRQLRAYIKRADSLILAAAKGNFPGGRGVGNGS